MLQRNLLDAVATYIATIGMGSIGSNLFKMTMPESPHTCTAIVLSGGPVIIGDPTNRPSFQILHRNTDINSGTTLIDSLYYALHNQVNVLPNMNGFIEAKHLPGVHFRDDNNHPVFSLNFAFITTQQI